MRAISANVFYNENDEAIVIWIDTHLNLFLYHRIVNNPINQIWLNHMIRPNYSAGQIFVHTIYFNFSSKNTLIHIVSFGMFILFLTISALNLFIHSVAV